MKCTLESVGVNGEFQGDFTAGRVVNPGPVSYTHLVRFLHTTAARSGTYFPARPPVFKGRLNW